MAEVLAPSKETPQRDDQVLELGAAGVRPWCHNRRPWEGLHHPGDMDRGIALMEDDSQIDDLRVLRDEPIKGGRLLVTITELEAMRRRAA